jgi:hypothetical protein
VQRNYATKEVMVGEVFVECTAKTDFPGFGFSGLGESGARWSRKGLPEEEVHLVGAKDGDWIYTE